jgi:uridine phosphorylase
MEVMPHLKLRDDLGIQYAILPGDPARVERIAEQLEDVEELEFNREYKSIAGTYKGIRMLAVSTGIGGPSTGIAVEELARIGVTHAIRIGSCGALQKEIRLGDLILVQGAVRDEGTSRTYIDSIYPAIPDFELMHDGKLVETGRVEDIFRHPKHPYTKALIESIPIPDPHRERQRAREKEHE